MKSPSRSLGNRKGRELMTRPPLDRMQRIFREIKAGKCPNRLSLSAEIEVTTKTIQRDLDFMRERLKLPIAYNDQKQGYELTSPIEGFPMIELSEAELISVFVAQKALAQYKGTPFEPPLRGAFDKLVSSLEGKISLSWDALDSCISFRSFDLVPADLKTFQVVSEAVRNNTVLEFEYKKLNATSFSKRTTEPYHLACIQNQWYCFAFDVDRRDFRIFVLARMRGAVTKGQTFIKSQKFSLEKYLADSFSVFHGKEKYGVKIRFDRFAAQLVRERTWHSSQQVQELTGGEIEFRATLSSLDEIEPWVLSWGGHANVLAPKKLRTRILAVAKQQIERYSQ